MLLLNPEGVSYDVALLTKRYYEDKLIENDNIGYIKVVPFVDIHGNKNGRFNIEVGVFDKSLQEKNNIIPNNKNGTILNIDEFNNDATVPKYLAVPEQLESSKSFFLTEDLLRNSVQANNKININHPVSANKFVKVTIKLTERFFGLAFTKEQETMQGGISANNWRPAQCGTLGAIVKLPHSNNNYILSNWHVFSNSGAQIGDEILHPSPCDNGQKDKNKIASLVWYRLDSYMDVALARLNSNIAITKNTKCEYSINGQSHAKVDMKVKKCGRTTEFQEGTITNLHASYFVEHPEYPGRRIFFKDQIEIKIKCRAGDSGSILVEDESGSNQAIGLVFAGNKKSICLANHLDFNNSHCEPLSEDRDSSITNLNINFNK